MSSIPDFKAREEQLRRLDAELNSRKNEVVRRAEELVHQQATRLAQMETDAARQQYASTSYDHHTFDERDQGFLDETTGYRGRVETATGRPAAASRPTSGGPSATAARSLSRAATESTSHASTTPSYVRPVSAATQEGRRRASGIPTPGAAAATSAAASRVSSASAARATPSFSTTAASASRPQSRARTSIAPPAPASFSRQPSYESEHDQHEADEGIPDEAYDGAGATNDDDGADGNTGLDDAGLDMPVTGAMGSAATIRFQKARIQALSTSVASLTTTLAARDKELTELKLLVKSSNEAREKLARAKEALEKSSSATSKTVSDLETKLASAQGEATKYRREVQSFEKTRKDLEAENKAKDARLNRCLAELERLKEQLARTKSGGAGGAGGGSTEEAMRELSNLRLANKKLLQQRADLLAGFKKQARLIEVLKKQKLHMELAKMLQFTEEEFAKSLEMGEI